MYVVQARRCVNIFLFFSRSVYYKLKYYVVIVIKRQAAYREDELGTVTLSAEYPTWTNVSRISLLACTKLNIL